MTISSSAVLPNRIDEHDAAGIIAWAAQSFGPGLVFTASFEDPVLVHLVATNAPSTPIVLLDTQYLFDETLAYVQTLRQTIGFDLTVVRPLPDVVPDEQWRTSLEGCCGRRKVEPLGRALSNRTAWITGIRRVDGPTRADAPAVSFDLLRQMTKINPLVAWSDEDMLDYVARFDLPTHPLVEKGYSSIGCAPCTRPVLPGEDRRAGRWSGSEKTECGLHTT
ncbi:MAG: phosphoadenylyl-sulfate reductase [Actinomycetota bacterium]